MWCRRRRSPPQAVRRQGVKREGWLSALHHDGRLADGQQDPGGAQRPVVPLAAQTPLALGEGREAVLEGGTDLARRQGQHHRDHPDLYRASFTSLCSRTRSAWPC